MMEAEIAEPLKGRPNTELLKTYVAENKEIFHTDGNKLFCKICDKSISFKTKFLVHRHLKSKKHHTFSSETSIEVKPKTVAVELSTAELLKNHVLQNAQIFETDGEILLCKVCKKSVPFKGKLSVDQHLKTEMHKNNYAQRAREAPCNSDYQPFSLDRKSLFILEKNEDFCRTCLKQFSKTKQKDSGNQSITEIPAGCHQNTTIMELLETIQPQIKIEIEDQLPTLMCSDCIQKLIVSFKFIKMYKNSDKTLRTILVKFNKHQQFFKEIEIQDHDKNKYEDALELINIDALEKEDNENSNQQPEVEKECIHEQSEDTSNLEILVPSSFNDASVDNWASEIICPNDSIKKINFDGDNDVVTKKVFKGFFQPEENEDGCLTCQLCESVLGGVIPWREHIRQNHLQERPKRAYNRRTKEPRKKETSKVSRKFLPNDKGLYQCEYCEKSYPKYLFYRRHLRIHTEGTHLCVECGKSFSNTTSYNSHMLRHKGEKSFQCSQCPKSFVCPSDLYGHMMTHNDYKPYICDICGSAFRMPYQLRNHNRVHTGIKNYKCEYCDMRFKNRPNQVCHMRTHTGEKPFRCKYCERAFAQSGDCVKHMRQHFGDNNVYQCDLCPLRFPLVRDLRTHFATHKNDDEETRNRNLQARMEEEKNLRIKLCSKGSE